MASGLDRMVLGDNFDVTRPTWCLLIKLTQGLNDSLFQHKFHDWEVVTLHMYKTPAHPKASSSPASVLCEEEIAWNLGRSRKFFFFD